MRHPIWMIGLSLAISTLALSSLVDLRSGEPRISLDPSIESLLPANDPGRIYYDRAKLLFDGGEMMLVALVHDQAFSPENLERLVAISEAIEELDEIHHVSSLSTALNIRGDGGELLVEPFFDAIPRDPDQIADLKSRALDDPIYAGNLVSRDGRVLVVAAQLLDLPEREILDSRLDERIRAIAEANRGDAEVWITGDPHVKAEMTRLMMRDLTFVVPICVFFMCVVALLSFRSIRGVAIPLLTIGVSILWSVGLISSLYGQLNQVTVAAPPILLVVGFAYAIHLLSAYYDAVREGAGDREEIVRSAVGNVAIPLFFTGITTAAGFLSLTTSPLVAIQQFGVFCGAGAGITMVVCLTLAPALLSLLPVPVKVRDRPARDGFDYRLEKLAHFDLRHRGGILTAWGLVALLSLWGMSRIVVGTDMVSNFKLVNPVRQHFDLINEALEGASEFQIVLDAGIGEAFKEPENLRIVEALQEWLALQPEIGGSTSVVDYVKVIHRGLQDGSEAWYRIPDSREAVSQLLVIGGNEEIDRFVDSGYEVAKLSVRTSAMDSADVMDLVNRVEAYLARIPTNLRWEVTGSSVLISRTMDDIALGQALSLGTAFIIIYAILALLFTSLRIGFVALIPNAMPVLIYFGILGWTGVTLNTTTGLVACLVLGIAVDDTIHLMAHFNAAAKREADVNKGVVHALRSVGRPVTYTTLALCLGFICLTLSDSRSQIEFGWLSALTLGVAWAVDVTFTPAIAGRLRIVTLWDILSLDLGRDPHLSIPLLEGLKPAQARIAALLGSIHEFPDGFHLFKMGEQGDELYVVIDGALEASIETEDGQLKLREHRRGDVIGEVALFEGERTADVRSLTPVRLLRLTQADLARIKRRYPRIGAQLYANLSRVLADRLNSVTRRLGER